LVDHMLRGRGTDVTEAIGGRRCRAALACLEFTQKRLRNRMRWTTQAYGVLAAGNGSRDVWGALQNQRERARPERIGKLARNGRNVASPVSKIGIGREVHDYRMVGRSSLGRVDFGHCLGV